MTNKNPVDLLKTMFNAIQSRFPRKPESTAEEPISQPLIPLLPNSRAQEAPVQALPMQELVRGNVRDEYTGNRRAKVNYGDLKRRATKKKVLERIAAQRYQDVQMRSADAPPGMVDAEVRGPAPAYFMGPVINGGFTKAHPLRVVKATLRNELPNKYWSTYNKTVHIGNDGKFTRPGYGRAVRTTATKIKWRKVLGEVLSLHGKRTVAYTKKHIGDYADGVGGKRNKQALSRRVGRRLFKRSGGWGRRRRGRQ